MPGLMRRGALLLIVLMAAGQVRPAPAGHSRRGRWSGWRLAVAWYRRGIGWGRRAAGGARLTLRLGPATVTLGAGWLLAGPLATWGIGALYLPLLAPSLDGAAVWVVAAALALAVAGSLVLHALAHAGVARLTGSPVPAAPSVGVLGDAAQAWPAAPDPGREAAVALAGPLVHLLLAGAAYLLWDRQLLPVLDVGLVFVGLANLALAVVNLGPGFPLDGGRLARALGWWWLGSPATATRFGRWLGWLQVAGLLGWSLVLGLQPARFNHETSLGTLLAAGLLWAALRRPSAVPAGPVGSGRSSRPHRLMGGLIAGTLLLLQLALAASLLPTLHGLYAPGPVAPVEPMIAIAPAYRHEPAGDFLLTTVVTQTPILVGEWAYSAVDPAVALVPPEMVVPEEVSPGEAMAQQYDLLAESIGTATAVGEQLAGYPPLWSSQGAEVVDVVADSPARDLLQPGDRIVAVNGAPITLADEVAAALRAQPAATTVTVLVDRAGQHQELTVPLLPPGASDDAPRLGVLLQTVGLTMELPVAVAVEPQKILGGPSAGLMLTLTIYDLLTPEDLTHGQRIAGTGTISLDGTVGAIGGVTQKVAAAERAGAAYFLVPPANAAEAQRAARRITVIVAPTAQAAIDALRDVPARSHQDGA